MSITSPSHTKHKKIQFITSPISPIDTSDYPYETRKNESHIITYPHTNNYDDNFKDHSLEHRKLKPCSCSYLKHSLNQTVQQMILSHENTKKFAPLKILSPNTFLSPNQTQNIDQIEDGYYMIDYQSRGGIERIMYIQRSWRRYFMIKHISAEFIQSKIKGYLFRRKFRKLIERLRKYKEKLGEIQKIIDRYYIKTRFRLLKSIYESRMRSIYKGKLLYDLFSKMKLKNDLIEEELKRIKNRKEVCLVNSYSYTNDKVKVKRILIPAIIYKKTFNLYETYKIYRLYDELIIKIRKNKERIKIALLEKECFERKQKELQITSHLSNSNNKSISLAYNSIRSKFHISSILIQKSSFYRKSGFIKIISYKQISIISLTYHPIENSLNQKYKTKKVILNNSSFSKESFFNSNTYKLHECINQYILNKKINFKNKAKYESLYYINNKLENFFFSIEPKQDVVKIKREFNKNKHVNIKVTINKVYDENVDDFNKFDFFGKYNNDRNQKKSKKRQRKISNIYNNCVIDRDALYHRLINNRYSYYQGNSENNIDAKSCDPIRIHHRHGNIKSMKNDSTQISPLKETSTRYTYNPYLISNNRNDGLVHMKSKHIIINSPEDISIDENISNLAKKPKYSVYTNIVLSN